MKFFASGTGNMALNSIQAYDFYVYQTVRNRRRGVTLNTYAHLRPLDTDEVPRRMEQETLASKMKDLQDLLITV